ncbi:MAG: methylated-DNA--[protein]-cysteine S-methyltransferase [Gemmatimonadota bacterium]
MNTDQSLCTQDAVLAYVAGELEERRTEAMALHLGECPPCCRQAAEFQVLLELLPAECRSAVIRWHDFPTPFGRMFLVAGDRGLLRLTWNQADPDGFAAELERRFTGCPVLRDAEGLADIEAQLGEYFEGRRAQFEISVDLSGLSAFERRVLEGVRQVPFGQVIPYSELARRIGTPRGARAVGNALGRNPVAIVIPCHRVVRRDGSLGGYTGGLHYKRHLLTIEGSGDLARTG